MKCTMCRFDVDPETGKCPFGHRAKSFVAGQPGLVDPGSSHRKRRKPRAKAVVIGLVIGLALMLVLALPGLLSGSPVRLTFSHASPPPSGVIDARQKLVNACVPTIEAMKAAHIPTHKPDPVLTVQRVKLAALPIPLNYPSKVTWRGTYRTADQYIHDSAIPDIDSWRMLMKRDSFSLGAAVDFAAGPDHWNAVALRFGSPAKAADYQRTSIGMFCSLGLIKGLTQIPSMPGSFTLTRLDPTSPYRALLLVGSSVVHLNLCSCVETSNEIGLVTRWANVVGAQLGLRAPLPSAQA